jgi:RHS repeat-associated protein
MQRERKLAAVWSVLALVVAAACSSEKQDKPDPGEQHLGKTSSALTITRYEGESMAWSGVEGADGQIRTVPAPTHRYFWTNGYVAQNHDFVGGSTTLVVRAMGDLLAGVGPHIVVSVAGATVGSAFVNETAFTSKTFTFNAAAGAQDVRVTFDNDDASSTEDRNLSLDWVEVQEPPASGGTCTDTSYEGEAMAWSGVTGTDGEVRTTPAPAHRYFWQDSYVSQSHPFLAQPMRIRVHAAGDLVDGVGPHVVVSVGGVEIGSAFVNDASYVDKVFEFTPAAGTQQIRVTYDNDLWRSPGGAGNDRNLLLDKVDVLCGSAVDAGADSGADGGATCAPANCGDRLPCQTGTCTAGTCSYATVANGAACSDANSCTVNDQCVSGTCTGTPVSLSPPPCTTRTCDPATGIHDAPSALGTACPNGNVCDGNEACDGAGTCQAGPPPVIDDGNPCTTDSCDAVTGVSHTARPAGSDCSTDNNVCNGIETCSASGTCRAGSPPVTDDGNLCTVDACQPATGVTHTTIPNCDPTPVQGNAPFESRASLMGRLITSNGGAVTGASFTVTEAPAPEGSGAVRGDVSASTAGDGSFRLRLTTFPDVATDRTPPLHVLLRVTAAGVLPIFRDVWLHTGTAADLGIIKMVARDAAVTAIGPAGGTASDSANSVQVVIPAGALGSTVNVVITPFHARDEFPAPLPDATATMYGFELEPSGTTFASPVTVRIANTKNIPTTFSIPTGFYDPTVARWDHVAQATWDGSRFAFLTTHFSEYDGNEPLPEKPGVGASAPPPGPGDPCGGKCCAAGGGGPGPGGGGPPDGPGPSAGPEGSGDPLDGTGSRAGMNGGAVSQTFHLPTYRVRDEDFGITLGYDSGLAASRWLGAPPTDYQAAPHASHAVAVRGLRLSALAVPSGASGTTLATQPGLCGAKPVASFGQTTPIPLRADFSWAGSTTTQSFLMGATQTQADFGGFINLPTQAGQVAGSGLYATHVVVTAQTPSACVGSGGTFGVTNEQTAGTQLPLEAGPLATFDYHELVHHRLSSPYGTGWTIQELERVYRAGDTAFLVKGDGSSEKFRPRAYPHYLSQPAAPYVLTRDPQTGEIFYVTDGGDIRRVDPITGSPTTVLSGLPFSAGVRGAAIAYVGPARHFAVALATGLVDVDSGGATVTLATRPAAPQFHEPKVAARGDLVFYTDAESAPLFRTRLSDPSHAVAALSLASGGDVRLYPRTALSGVSFADPRGMDFGADGTLYLADVQRNAVYAISPQANGEVGPDSVVALAVGDGTSNFLATPGERVPGQKLAVREPLVVTTAEDGTVMIVTAYGVAWYDPLAREAEWLAFWSGLDEMALAPTSLWATALALGPSSLLVRNSGSDGQLFLTRIDIDRLSSELEPTRTLTTLSGGALELVDTNRAIVESFDAAGRIAQRKRRTGELTMSFSYADAQSDKLDHVSDVAGGQTVFAYDGAGKLQRITDARGRITNVSVTDLGDLISFQKPDLETYQFTYAEHRMTQKRSPYGDLTNYTFRANGTVATLTKPGGQLTTVDAVLSHPPTYDATGKLIRAGSYTDGHGVTHQVQVNGRGEIEKDTYVADGVTRVEQSVYADPLAIADPDSAYPISDPGTGALLPEAGGTQRKNTLYRVSHRTVNGIAMGPEMRFWDAHFRPRARFVPTQSPALDHVWLFAADGWLRGELLGRSNLGQAYARDASGHVIQSYDTSDPQAAIPPASGQLAGYTYRSDGQLATKTEHGVATTFAYDDAGGTLNRLGWTDAVGRSMAYVLDARGNVTQTSDGTATTHAAYDVHNRVIETQDALGNATTYGYNATGCGCSQENLVTNIHTPDLPAGVDWLMTYDGDGRLASVRDPHSFTESYAYEATGELKKLTDKLARDTTWTHDQLGRVASMMDTLGRSHGNAYTVPAAGVWTGPTLLAGSGDATASTTSLSTALRAGDYQIGQNAYPTHGQPAGITLYRDATFALGFTRLFDINRRLTARADRSAFAIDSATMPGFFSTSAFWYQQNNWNINTARAVLASTATTNANDTGRGSTYQQDIYFDDTSADGSGLFQDLETFGRDTAGRVTTLARRFDSGGDVTSTYTYRPDGRMSRLVNPDGTHDFTYDSRGQMQTQVVSGEGTYAYGYDVMGRPSSLTYPDGHTRTQVYDDLGRITSRCYGYSGPTTRCYTASYDAVGNPVTMSDPDGSDTFVYDALDRLSKVTRVASGVTTVEDYAYNALGALKVNAGVALNDQRPRLDGAGTADAAVPASVGGQPVVLDAGGRVTSLRGTTFTWTKDGTLREADDPIPAAPETYGVDARSRRYSRIVSGVAQEYYAYEGMDRVAVMGPGDGVTRTLIESYLFDGIDHPLRIARPGVATTNYYYYELDLAGNVRGLRASGGASLGGYRYAAFGQTLEDTSLIAQPLRWKARWFSPVAGGTYDVRARQWSPELGVFLSVDEYGWHDDRTTLWGWPWMNPPRFRDPSGRGPIEIVQCLLAGRGLGACMEEEQERFDHGPAGNGGPGGGGPGGPGGGGPGGPGGGGPGGGGGGGGYRDPARPDPDFGPCSSKWGLQRLTCCKNLCSGEPADSPPICVPIPPKGSPVHQCMQRCMANPY